MRSVFTCLLLFSLQTPPLAAQPDSLPPPQLLPAATVSAARLTTERVRLPFAVAVLNKTDLQTARQQLSLHDALTAAPGVFVQNPDNFAQDLRISIRGFGARAAFGIRGIRIVADGIPESTPDGQADVDNIDAGALENAEILKGGASARYGNASGGVIYLRTESLPAGPYAEVMAAGGSFGFRRYQAKAGFRRAWLSVGYNEQQGYRDHAALRQLNVNHKWRFDLSPKTGLTLLFSYVNSPQADDAGGLTAEQVAADRRQARPQHLQFDAGENLEQGRAGAVLTHRLTDGGRLTVRAFGTARRFDNRLGFQNGGTVALRRVFGGGGIHYETEGRLFRRIYRTQAGFDLDWLNDHRSRFDNLDGLRGPLTLDQREKFASAGLFWLNELIISEKWLLDVSARFDRLTPAIEDLFRGDGDQSGRRLMHRLSPAAGLSWRVRPGWYWYANLGANYETPTLNEWSANPANTGGFNAELKPQRALNTETGLKISALGKLHLEMALFFIGLRDEFVPYQLMQFPGRTFYRNAGRSRRQGLELSLRWAPLPSLAFGLAYTYSDFRFIEYRPAGDDLGGRRTPGIPQHQGSLEGRWTPPGGLILIVQARHAGRFYADDANLVANDAYTPVSVRAAFSRAFPRFSVEPFAGLNNVFNRPYNGNVLINAAGGRFFEPAAGLYGYGGVKIRLTGSGR